MTEFDELVAQDGVLMAGRLSPDGRVAEYKADPWYIENPAAIQMAQWFCAMITMMLGSMAYAIDGVSHGGFDQSSWRPVTGWAFTGATTRLSCAATGSWSPSAPSWAALMNWTAC